MATTRLQKLSNTMLRLEKQGVFTEEQYETYRLLLGLHFSAQSVVANWENNRLADSVCDLDGSPENLK
jgi:hypothetical protein